MKKVHSINREALRLLTTVLLLFMVCIATNAYDFKENDIFYNILSEDDLTCEVTYRASSNKDVYTGDVVIPETATYLGKTYSVVAIGRSAFSGCSELTRITIPENVTKIGTDAFYHCTGLKEVSIPNSVTTIGSYAFQGCTGLTGELTIPNSVTSIGDYAFYGCAGLTSVTIGNSVTSIGELAFYECSRLTNLTIGNSVTSIGSHAFYKCSGLTGELTIPNSVETIGDYAFYYCSGLTGSLTIGNNVTLIGSYTFEGCSGLTRVTFGESVTEIGGEAFYYCSGLESIYSLNPEAPTCSASNNGPFFYKVPTNTCVLYVPIGATKSYSEARGWREFYYIEEIDVSPVADILAGGNAEATGYYTTDGKQVPTLQKGMNIIRYSDGTSKKVLVK